MNVRVRLFAALRERAGSGSVEVELPDGARVGDVWSALDLGDEPPGILFAVNKAYADRGAALSPGDEVALIPPVSGGSFRLVEGPLSLDAAVDEVRGDGAGAIATFTGTVRDRSRDRDVLHLEYEAYEGMAEEVMADLAHAAPRAPRPDRHLDPPPRRPRRDRRGERRHRDLRPAPRRGARRVQGGDRRAQDLGPAVEEGGLRGRRGVDRPGVVEPEGDARGARGPDAPRPHALRSTASAATSRCTRAAASSTC